MLFISVRSDRFAYREKLKYFSMFVTRSGLKHHCSLMVVLSKTNMKLIIKSFFTIFVVTTWEKITKCKFPTQMKTDVYHHFRRLLLCNSSLVQNVPQSKAHQEKGKTLVEYDNSLETKAKAKPFKLSFLDHPNQAQKSKKVLHLISSF